MTSENLVTVPVGTTLDAGTGRFCTSTVSRSFPVVDRRRAARGASLRSRTSSSAGMYPDACKDEHGRLRVGAAVGASSHADMERAALLCPTQGVGRLSSSTRLTATLEGVLDADRAACGRRFPDVQLVGGQRGHGGGSRGRWYERGRRRREGRRRARDRSVRRGW